jgi:hypothetical protein
VLKDRKERKEKENDGQSATFATCNDSICKSVLLLYQ